MKQLYFFVLTTFSAVLLGTSCVDDPDLGTDIHNAKKPTVNTLEILKTTASSVTVSGEVVKENGSPVTESGFCWSTDSSFVQKMKKAVSKRKTQFEATIEDLANNKDFFIRAYAVNRVDTAYGEILSFKTKYGVGAVKTSLPIQIKSTSAQCGGVITLQGEAEVKDRGIYLMQKPEPSETDSIISISMTTDSFYCTVTDLKPNMKYYYRAYATNKFGKFFGAKVESFTTKDGLGEIKTLAATDIHSTSVQCGGKIIEYGEHAIIKRGIYLMQNPEPSNTDSMIIGSLKTDSFFCTITNLKPETKYYYRAFAENKFGEFKGAEILSFTTTDGLPVLDNEQFTLLSIDYGSADFSMKVTDEGDKPITACGFCYGNAPQPTIENDTIVVGKGVGVFNGHIQDLNDDTKYYVRAFVTNGYGTRYSEGEGMQVDVESGRPKMIINNVSDIVDGTAIINGEILSKGGSTIIAVGLCWGTEPDPTIEKSEKSTEIYPSSRNFKEIIRGLKGNKIYHVRAYAKNTYGIEYSNQVSFNTPKIFADQSQFGGGFRIPGSASFCSIGTKAGCFLGGDKGSSYTNEFWCFVNGEWHSLWNLPEKLSGTTSFSNGQGVWVYGGINDENKLNENLFYYSSYENKWKLVKEDKDTRPTPAFRPSSITSDSHVYLVGGRRETLLDEVWDFDLEQMKWTPGTKFPIRQYGGISVMLNNRIYAGFGIVSINDMYPTFTNKFWSTDTNFTEWREESDFPAFALLCGVAFQNRLYGVDGDGYIWCYDPSTKTWTQKSQLPINNRKVHCIYQLNDKIYIGLGTYSDTLIQYDPLWDN